MPSNLVKLGLSVLDAVINNAPNSYAVKTLAVCRELVKVVSENDRNTAIVERILDVANLLATSLATLKLEANHDIVFQIDQFLLSLERLSKVLGQQAHQGRLRRLVLKSYHASTTHRAEEELDIVMARLSIKLQSVNTSAIRELQVDAPQTGLEEKLARHRSERISVIKKRLLEINTSRRPIPPCPQVFFGRESETESLVQLFQREDSAFAAILGPGGIGKTALGLSILHHPVTASVYSSFKWFLSCESIDDSSTLSAALAALFQVEPKRLIAEITDVARQLDSKMLILLDNFETPWEPAAHRKDVETLLEKLAKVPKLSILITMRGSEYPRGISWSEPIPPLSTLDFASAKQVFVSVSGKESSEGGIDELLNATACLPLAVVLMASQAQYSNCSDLVESWHREKTSMLSIGHNGRLSSLDVSIKVSLSGERVRGCPDVIRILQLLATLPDGVDQSDLECMTPEDISVSRVICTLLQVALAYRDETDRIRVLSPIMEHINVYNPISETMLGPVLGYFSKLGNTARHNTYTLLRFELASKLTCQLSNIRQVLDRCLENEAQCDASALTVAKIAFFSRFGEAFPAKFITSLLSNASQKCRNFGFRLSLAHLLVEQASIGGYLQYEGIRQHLDDAIPILREFSDQNGLANALLTYAVCLLNAGMAVDATEKLDEVSGILTEETPNYLRVRVYGIRASILHTQGSTQKAIGVLKLGLTEGKLTDCPILSITMQLRIASYNISVCRVQDAVNTLERLLGEFGDHDSAAALAWEFMGEAYLVQSRLTDAERVNAHVMATARKLGRTPFIQRKLAEICLARGDYDSAQLIYESLLEVIDPQDLRYKNVYSAVRIGLQRIAMAKGEFTTALMHVNVAHVTLRKNETFPFGQMTTHIARADWFLSCGLPSQAITDLVLACLIGRKFSDIGCLGSAIQRLGDVFLMECEDIPTARSCYQVTQYTIRGQNLRRHFADSLLRLGALLLVEGKTSDAHRTFEEGSQYFTEGEDPSGCRWCDARRDECVNEGDMQKRINAFSPLPLGTFLGLL